MARVHFLAQSFPYDRWGGVAPLAEAARAAEELGFAAIQLPDHVLMPVRPGKGPARRVWYDPLVLGAYLAGQTQRLRLVFNILVVPYRPPVQLAKTVSTLDTVSRGRVTLGVGSGWLQREFEVLGVPFEERGARTDETLRIMRELWTGEEASFERDGVRYDGFAFEPRCVQEPHVQLWIGGSGPRPMRRALEFGDGWTPMVGDLAELRKSSDWLREQLAARGRDPESFDFCYHVNVGEGDREVEGARSHVAGADVGGSAADDSPQATVDRVAALAEIGFRHLTVHFAWQTPADYVRQLEWFARHVMPAFA